MTWKKEEVHILVTILIAGDVLIKIADDDIRGWPMPRVAKRLNPFRIPPGSRFTLTFARAIKVHMCGCIVSSDVSDLCMFTI